MAPRRQIFGALASVLLHAGLLGWATTRATTHEAPAPILVEVERIELAPVVARPLARRASGGAPSHGTPQALRADTESATPEPRAAPREPSPPPRPRSPAPSRAEATTTPTPSTQASPTHAPATDTPTNPDAPTTSPANDDAGRASTAGTRDGIGSAGSDSAGIGDGGADHSAYGAELVRLVKAEIDTDPVPGLRPHDSIEVVLEVLPSGRLARWGLGKYDYARVVHSTLGPLRLRAILRRILRASEAFPPHPSSFPRQRYVVGFTVRFSKDGRATPLPTMGRRARARDL